MIWLDVSYTIVDWQDWRSLESVEKKGGKEEEEEEEEGNPPAIQPPSLSFLSHIQNSSYKSS